MGRVQDKVAFITGAARGQGHSHAVRLAQEGADNALAPLGVTIRSQPLSPSEIVTLIRASRGTGWHVLEQPREAREPGTGAISDAFHISEGRLAGN